MIYSHCFKLVAALHPLLALLLALILVLMLVLVLVKVPVLAVEQKPATNVPTAKQLVLASEQQLAL